MTRFRVLIEESADHRYRFVTQQRVWRWFWRSGVPSAWFDNYDRLLEEMHAIHWRLVEQATGTHASRQVRRARARRWVQRKAI